MRKIILNDKYFIAIDKPYGIERTNFSCGNKNHNSCLVNIQSTGSKHEYIDDELLDKYAFLFPEKESLVQSVKQFQKDNPR